MCIKKISLSKGVPYESNSRNTKIHTKQRGYWIKRRSRNHWDTWGCESFEEFNVEKLHCNQLGGRQWVRRKIKGKNWVSSIQECVRALVRGIVGLLVEY